MPKQKFIPRPKESAKVIKKRWSKKRESVETLSNNIQRLRYNVSTDLKSDNEKIFLTALVVAIMDKTAERVGNEESASNGHVGITGLKKNQVNVIGNKVILQYIGKSGVEHTKMFSDSRIAQALKKAKKNSPDRFVFNTSDKFKIKANRVNRYLSDFGISAKDIRGYSCNKWIITKLKEVEPESTEYKRNRQFNVIVKRVAAKVGHGSTTLKKHYLIPEVEPLFVEKGEVVDIDDVKKFNEGGEIKNDTTKKKVEKTKKTEVDSTHELFELSKAKDVGEVSSNIDKILKEYSSRTMAAIQVESYLNEIDKELAKNFLTENNISERDGLVSYANSRQAIVRSGVRKKRKESIQKIEDEKAQFHIDNIMKLALIQSDEYDKKIKDSEEKTFGGELGSERLGVTNKLSIAKDGFKRFEISDDKAKIIVNIDDVLSGNIKNIPLTQFIMHRDLFKAYPELKYYKVFFKKQEDYINKYKQLSVFKNEFTIFMGSLAYDNVNDKEKHILIYIDYERANREPTAKVYNFLLRCGLAETQHAIQQIEGYGEERGLPYYIAEEQRKNGRDIETLWNKIVSLPEKSIERIQAENDYNVLIKYVFDNAYIEYENQFLEIESRESVKRIPLSAEERIHIPSLIYDSMKKGGDINPFAVCTSSIGKTEGTTKRSSWSNNSMKKYEKCVLQLKEKKHDGGLLTILENQVFEGDKKLRDMTFQEAEKYMGIHYEKNDNNPFIIEGYFVVWFYDTPEFSKKINEGEWDFLMFPMEVGVDYGGEGSIHHIWRSEFQNKYKGAKNLLGMLYGWYNKSKNQISIDLMSVRPNIKRNRINSFMVKEAKKFFNTDDVRFDLPTTEGLNFIDAKTYGKGGEILLAPNGNKSNLNEKQYSLVRTKEFKDWFGDWENDPENSSKVVDENGEPLVVYHGTNSYFNKFNINIDETIFFSKEKKLAQLYGFRLIPVFIKALKIDVVNQTKGKWWKEKYEIVETAINSMTIKNMYDCIVLKYVSDPPFYEKDKPQVYSDIYIVSNRYSIKLADGSNTTFNDDSDDIRFIKGGEIENIHYLKVMKGFDYVGTLKFDPNNNERVNNLPDLISAAQKSGYRIIPINKDEYFEWIGKIDYEKLKKFQEDVDIIVDDFKKGGELTSDEKDKIYSDWKELINMPLSELKKFYESEEGKEAGLSSKEANELGIHSGRESARWIMKMKQTPNHEWTNEMWDWAKRQISFVKRMLGNKGDLYDDKGNKTRKHLALNIWGHKI